MIVGDDRAASKEPTARLEELKEQVERASTLIGELRETNYSLSTQVVELKNRLAAGDSELASSSKREASAESRGESEGEAASDSDESGLAEEVELLRTEREAVRKKLKSLIARIEKLES